jgi:hypothetical protein
MGLRLLEGARGFTVPHVTPFRCVKYRLPSMSTTRCAAAGSTAAGTAPAGRLCATQHPLYLQQVVLFETKFTSFFSAGCREALRCGGCWSCWVGHGLLFAGERSLLVTAHSNTHPGHSNSDKLHVIHCNTILHEHAAFQRQHRVICSDPRHHNGVRITVHSLRQPLHSLAGEKGWPTLCNVCCSCRDRAAAMLLCMSQSMMQLALVLGALAQLQDSCTPSHQQAR